MTPEQMTAAVQKYDAQLEAEGIESRYLDSSVARASLLVRLQHVRWMCQQVPAFVVEGKLEKANRWIGFIQGSLWTLNRGTIASFKDDNR